MVGNFDKGIAFIGEGATEVVFYEEYLKFVAKAKACSFEPLDVVGEAAYRFDAPGQTSLVMMHSTNTVSQLPNASSWFNRACDASNPSIPWDVILAYDTESHSDNVSQFYQGDWLRLRTDLVAAGATIIDMAAAADIEDVMLIDLLGVLAFLELPLNTLLPSGRKGKAKMKKLFRMKALNLKYREGEKARPLIRALDMSLIEKNASLPFSDLRSSFGV